MKTVSTLLVTAAILSMSNAYAESPLRDGDYTLDIGNNAGPWVGGRMFLNSDSAIEVAATLQQQSKDSDTGQLSGIQLGVTAGYMKYISQDTVSPFWRTGGSLIILSGDAYNNQDTQLSGYAGLGAEYMITKNFSIRGSVNINLKISPSVDLATSSSDLRLSFFF